MHNIHSVKCYLTKLADEKQSSQSVVGWSISCLDPMCLWDLCSVACKCILGCFRIPSNHQCTLRQLFLDKLLAFPLPTLFSAHWYYLCDRCLFLFPAAWGLMAGLLRFASHRKKSPSRPGSQQRIFLDVSQAPSLHFATQLLNRCLNFLNKNNFTRQFLKCHYDENHIFSIESILKHEQVACMRRKMLFTIVKYLFFVPEIFKFLKYAN